MSCSRLPSSIKSVRSLNDRLQSSDVRFTDSSLHVDVIDAIRPTSAFRYVLVDEVHGCKGCRGIFTPEKLELVTDRLLR